MAFMRPLVNCLLLILAWLPVLAYSQALPAPDLPFSFVTAANESQFKPFMFNNSNYTNVNNLAKFSAANDGTFLATVQRSVPVGGGRMIPVQATYAASSGAVAGALGRFVAKIAMPLAVGVALYDLAKEIGIIGKTNPDGSRSYDQQTVVPQSAAYTSDGYMWHAGVGPSRATKELACEAWVSILGSGYNYLGATDYCYTSGGKFSLEQSGSSDCPAGTPLNSAGSCAPGALQDTIIHSPMNEEQFLQKVLQSPSILPRLIQEAIKSGESLNLEPRTITGPAKSPGPSSVTQNSNNTKTVTTTENKYTYGPNTVTTNTVSNTTIIDNSTGDILNESNTTGSPSTEPGVDMCTLYPDSLSCATLDDLPDVDLKTKDIPVAITPDGGWGGSAVCPAARHVTVQGYDVPIPFDLFCKYAELIRPLLLAFAWLSAAFILVGGVKET